MTDLDSPLAAYRRKHGVTLDVLADRCHVHKTTVLRWENGRIPAERVHDLERVTGIDRSLLRPDLFDINSASADPAKAPDALSAPVSQSDAERFPCAETNVPDPETNVPNLGTSVARSR